MANFCTALIAFALFFGVVLGGIAAAGHFMITDVAENSPAQEAGLVPNMMLKAINGKILETPRDLADAVNASNPGETITMTVYENGIERDISYILPEKSKKPASGIEIVTVTEGSPADKAGLKAGMIVTAAGEKTIAEQNDLAAVMDTVLPGETITFDVISGDETHLIAVETGENENTPGRAYLGITFKTVTPGGPADVSVGYFNANGYLETLRKIPSMMAGNVPEGSEGSRIGTIIAGWFILLSLPFFGLLGEGFTGFSGAIMDFYQAAGWAEPLGIAVFWIANILLWIGWMNFYVGLFNCLPSFPLDGGHVFRAAIQSLLEKCRVSEYDAEILSGKICLTLTVMIMISFLFMIVWPHIGKYFA